MRKLLCIVLIFLVFVYVGLVFAGAGEAHHGVTSAQIKNLIWWTMNFLVFLLIVWKWVRPFVVSMFEQRRENIIREYNELLEKKKEAEAKYIELQEKVKNLEKEAKEIYERYVAQGMKEKERIIKEAEEQAQRLRQQVDLYIQQEIEKAKKLLREEVAEASIKLAEEILQKNFTEEDHKRLYQEFINNIKGRVVH